MEREVNPPNLTQTLPARFSTPTKEAPSTPPSPNPSLNELSDRFVKTRQKRPFSAGAVGRLERQPTPTPTPLFCFGRRRETDESHRLWRTLTTSQILSHQQTQKVDSSNHEKNERTENEATISDMKKMMKTQRTYKKGNPKLFVGKKRKKTKSNGLKDQKFPEKQNRFFAPTTESVASIGSMRSKHNKTRRSKVETELPDLLLINSQPSNATHTSRSTTYLTRDHSNREQSRGMSSKTVERRNDLTLSIHSRRSLPTCPQSSAETIRTVDSEDVVFEWRMDEAKKQNGRSSEHHRSVRPKTGPALSKHKTVLFPEHPTLAPSTQRIPTRFVESKDSHRKWNAIDPACSAPQSDTLRNGRAVKDMPSDHVWLERAQLDSTSSKSMQIPRSSSPIISVRSPHPRPYSSLHYGAVGVDSTRVESVSISQTLETAQPKPISKRSPERNIGGCLTVIPSLPSLPTDTVRDKEERKENEERIDSTAHILASPSISHKSLAFDSFATMFSTPPREEEKAEPEEQQSRWSGVPVRRYRTQFAPTLASLRRKSPPRHPLLLSPSLCQTLAHSLPK
ncbi:hypothetical protein BLNAU_5602 [Blattamonas nauphoetae]|uniref:Uncharacterized protein n=1 Tax=Blattamonas nauphoetae TaxID=2049346 RepID=A0ABQ9Y761_9EUKA|nr:hypothetical protein BLNAU_5602 [Blattamonas nauphoetae]